MALRSQRFPKLYGWLDGADVCLSVFPKGHERGAVNRYSSPHDAMNEAARRRMPIIWEDDAAIDIHPAMTR